VESRELQETEDLRVELDLQGHPECLGLKEPREVMAATDHPVLMDPQGLQDHLEIEVHLAYLDQPDQLDSGEWPDNKESEEVQS
jgi:hypothetical protein